MNKTKIGIAIILSLVVLLFVNVVGWALMAIMAIFAAWRLFALASHGWTCPTCQFKFFVALLGLVMLAFNPTAVILLLLVLIWLNVVLKDRTASGYSG